MRIGRLNSFVLVGGVGALALAAAGVNAATSIVTIQVTTETTVQQDPAVKGGLVAYTEYNVAGSGDVWVYNLDNGTRVRAVTNGASQSLEDLDANYVVYSDDRNSPELDIYALDLSSTPPTPTLEHAVVIAPGYQTEPAISGNRVVWEQSDPAVDPGNIDIFVGCVTGCSNIQLTSHPLVQFRPAVSGDLVVWEDARNGSPDIFGYWFVDPAGPGVAGENAIAIGGPRARNPDVNGTRVVWDQQLTGLDQKDIFLYDFATGVTTQITTNAANQTRPRISGNLIVWEDSRNSTTDLYGYDLNTNTEIAFVSGSLTEHLQDVDVRADGGWDIAYTVDQGGGNSDIFVLRATIVATPTPTATATATMTATPTPTPTPTTGDPCDPASGAPEYFSETFHRSTGAPVREERHFNAAAGPGTICLTLEHVSSAWVDLNDDEIFEPSDFNPNATSARADVMLLERNEVGVKLAGAPCDDEDCDEEEEEADDDDGDRRRLTQHKPGQDDDGDSDDNDRGDRDDRDDDDDDACARMTVRVVGPVPPSLSGLAAGVEGATETEAVPGAENGNGGGNGSGAACSVSAATSGSPLAGLLLLGGLVLATRRRRQQ